MNDSTNDLHYKIERCRRIASMMTDDEVRLALQQLAEEYEARLPRRGAGFMLQRRSEKRIPQRLAERIR